MSNDDNFGGVPPAPPFSEEAMALDFANRHRERVRFIAKWGKWVIWDGKVWREDEKRQAFSLAREIVREAAAQINRSAEKTASAKTRAAVVSLATDDQALAATVDQWDADPWILNTPGGIVDLPTGQMRPALPEDYCTKMTAVSPDGLCPKWMEFLETVSGSDQELITYLQKVTGYALTGLTSEHALFFLHGLGANGKSVFINTISGLLGDYHRTAPIETFTASFGDRHPTELAMLRGARLVTAVETEEGRSWAESRIKQLTGGDKIAARFMRQDYFEFVPQFKLVIGGNHKPGLRAVDEAIRRRMHLIPFSVTIPPERRDPELADKLEAEWSGILAWAIQGCRLWHDSKRLVRPKAVQAATDAYLESQDAVGAWLEEWTIADPGAWASSSVLYGSFKQWAFDAGEKLLSQKKLGDLLEARNFPRCPRKARGHLGLKLKGPYDRL